MLKLYVVDQPTQQIRQTNTSCMYPCCDKLTLQTDTCKPKVYVISLLTETPLMKFERDVPFVANNSCRMFIWLHVAAN